GAVEAARAQGVAMATVRTMGGPAVLAAAAQAAGAVALVGVTVLTSHSAGDFERVVGRGVPDLGFEAERLGRLAVAAGLRGVVASGHELALLRAALGPEPWIVVPGVRAPGDAADDQARTIAAADAVRGGATHLVVGRPITRAVDRAQAMELLRRHLRAGVERGLRVSAVREVEPGRGYAELDRRYVVAGTSDERRETIFLGFQKPGPEWLLAELRSAP